MKIDIKHDLKKITKHLDDLQKKQIPYATSLALNDLAFQLKDELSDEMEKKFDKPRKFTLNAFRVKKASKRRLRAVVYLHPSRSYLDMQFTGGKQRPSDGASVLTTPQHKSMFKSGSNDLRRGKIGRLLGSKKAFRGTPKGKPGGPSGVWQRMGTKKKPKLRFLAAYTTTRTFRRRIDLRSKADKLVKKQFRRAFHRGMTKAMRGARA